MGSRALLGGAALLAVLLVVWAVSFGGESPAALPAPEQQPAAPAKPPPVPAPPPAEREVAEAAAPAPAAAAPAEQPAAFDASPAGVEPWLARFLVVDEDEQPVGGAVITLWAATRTRPDPRLQKLTGQKGNSYSGHAPDALLEVTTDASGRAQTTLELECVAAAARREGLGRTGELYLWHKGAAEPETKLVLEVPIALRGVVLRADGSAAGGAVVKATINGGGAARSIAPRPEPVTAGTDGRFELPVRKLTGYNLRAEVDGEKTFGEWVMVRDDHPPEVVLALPGGITLSGVVVDARGQPVPGASVEAWREYHLGDPAQDADDYERVSATAGDDGRFSVAVRKRARYQLIASADGHGNSKPLWLETTDVRPHAEGRLELVALTTIAGRVVHADGSPFAGIMVTAKPETGEDKGYAAVPTQRDLFSRVTPATTREDGSFELAGVHPETTWTVLAFPEKKNYRLRFSQSGVAPGRDDIELRATDEATAGCVVHGTVVRADGQPLGPFRVDIVNYEDGAPRSSGRADAAIDGNRFTLPPLPLGGQFGVRVTPVDSDAEHARNTGPLAPAQVGPFVAEGAELAFELRLQRWGQVPVRVLDATGAPARKVRVLARPDVSLGFWPSAMPVDADGHIELGRCPPGPHHLQVFSDTEQLLERELLVTPGPNPEVEVRLPAGK